MEGKDCQRHVRTITFCHWVNWSGTRPADWFILPADITAASLLAVATKLTWCHGNTELFLGEVCAATDE